MSKLNPEFDEMVKQFALDFGIEYDNYTYSNRTTVISFNFVDKSPSEISYHSWTVPGFIVSKHYMLLSQAIDEARREARIQAFKDFPVVRMQKTR